MRFGLTLCTLSLIFLGVAAQSQEQCLDDDAACGKCYANRCYLGYMKSKKCCPDTSCKKGGGEGAYCWARDAGAECYYCTLYAPGE
ncbi:uncharacterized protein BKCO1_2500063 [Diplodia corticola]|uniref:Uncharacterized protein n=1 Tax=Diplodia corticola TaxID=236234 RepID=A0A1J9R1K2_9PEZI|nr:uncharacterized protein BKCO1_2500063 [Diplodia corticola]OJD34122.1 hypothetical protein BKCO1_2500063 [Diplodia corticola]